MLLSFASYGAAVLAFDIEPDKIRRIERAKGEVAFGGSVLKLVGNLVVPPA